MKPRAAAPVDNSIFDDGGPTGFENVTIMDRAFWLDEVDDQRVKPWIEAIEAADRRGDMAPFLAALRGCVPAEAFPFIKDFFARHQLAKKRGRQATPLYDRSRAEARLLIAVREVKELKGTGTPVAQAIEEVAARWFIEEDILVNAYDGRRGATRRQRARLKGLTSALKGQH